MLEAYCRDFEKPTPGTSDEFVIEGTDKKEAKILARGVEVGASNKVVQVAIWLDRGRKDAQDLKRRFEVTADELKIATRLTEVASMEVNADGDQRAADVVVELKDLVAKLRRRVQAARARQPLSRGNSARVVVRIAKLWQTKKGRKEIAQLSRGTTVEVVRVAGNRVVAQVEVDGRKRRGWLDAKDLKKESSRAAESDGILRDTALEVLKKLDVKVSDGATNIDVSGRRRAGGSN